MDLKLGLAIEQTETNSTTQAKQSKMGQSLIIQTQQTRVSSEAESGTISETGKAELNSTTTQLEATVGSETEPR